MAELFEIIMIVSFGISWPMNVIKSYKARTTTGKSLSFLFLIFFGYIAGIAAKIITGQINYVLIAYIVNLAIVSLNILIYFRNYSIDKKSQQESEA